MASYTTAWVIGSVRDLAYTAFTIDPDDGGGTPADGTVAISGDYYLWHDTDSISLVDKLVAQMTAAGCAGAAGILTRDRKVKISANAAFAISWSTDTGLRDLLGFTGNLSGASTYTATNTSPLLWSPQKRMRPMLSPLDTHGNRRPLAFWTASPSDGTPFVVSHGERTDQQWEVLCVAMSRMQTSSELGGEWCVFFEQCAEKGYNWMVYPDATEESGSSTSTLSTLTPALGPYVLTPNGRAPSWTFRRSRGLEWANSRADLTFDCRVVPELSNA